MHVDAARDQVRVLTDSEFWLTCKARSWAILLAADIGTHILCC